MDNVVTPNTCTTSGGIRKMNQGPTKGILQRIDKALKEGFVQNRCPMAGVYWKIFQYQDEEQIKSWEEADESNYSDFQALIIELEQESDIDWKSKVKQTDTLSDPTDRREKVNKQSERCRYFSNVN